MEVGLIQPDPVFISEEKIWTHKDIPKVHVHRGSSIKRDLKRN